MTPTLRLLRGRDVACGVVLLALAALLLIAPAYGQTAPPTPQPACLPNNALLKGTGSDYGLFETQEVSGRVGWCPSVPAGWHMGVHQWTLKKTPAAVGFSLTAAIDRVRAASSPLAQVQAEVSAIGQPITTDLDRWLFRDWAHQACQWLTSTQPGVTPRAPMPIAIPNPDGGIPALLTMTYCDYLDPGPRPAPPPPPADRFVVTATPLYVFTPDPPPGKRAVVALAGVAATRGQLCTCTGASMPFLQFSTRYCYVTVPNVTPIVVAVCSKAL